MWRNRCGVVDRVGFDEADDVRNVFRFRENSKRIVLFNSFPVQTVAEHRSWYAFCCIHTALNIDIDVQIHL
jgi:hypothetical protein